MDEVPYFIASQRVIPCYFDTYWDLVVYTDQTCSYGEYVEFVFVHDAEISFECYFYLRDRVLLVDFEVVAAEGVLI